MKRMLHAHVYLANFYLKTCGILGALSNSMDLHYKIVIEIVLVNCRCTICLGEYQEKEVLRIMPQCGHNFHLSCIDVWLRRKSTCPVCRLPLQDSLNTKNVRPATFSMSRHVNNPEITTEHSQHWLIPGVERSEENQISQGDIEPISGNIETVHYREAESR